MNKLSKLVGATAAATLVAISGTAFTAGNTMPTTVAGTGNVAVTGYQVSSVQYDADTTTPTNLAAVRFNLDKAARYVAIETHSAGQWFRSDDNRIDATAGTDSCTLTNASTFTWTCNVSNATPNETVEAANSLTVVATN